ncbi:MAG: hypothetical protein U9Q77_03695 [Candidatus Marinimicrobia bacterium]|nr:hypothetical protein [Candidatus Neomarinimicrobiota bacterium]
MFQLRRILLSGLVALLMVGMVTAGDTAELPDNDEVERSFIGSFVGGKCFDNLHWKCLHIEFTGAFDIPLPF